MSARPWCAGSGRAIAGDAAWEVGAIASCPVCGLRLTLVRACVPNHRERRCLVAGCIRPQTAGGVCAHHDKELVYGMEDE